ncbi:FG-GAP repeat domain-containing protein [Actinocatenispora rupis]|uniref:Repeat domain-containing protein n=1 Tax=Actinocatenispora rupis TaxID=519421 RepID=A0A8J3J8L6_9ACTN|nr:VCBS repeat-containing protein [Actinocatenispora rupis]GID11383.1 hypothetical protein Aru02nite_22720 [Actinocatenispora rupis]
MLTGLKNLYLTATDLAWTTNADPFVVRMLPTVAILDGTADTLTPATVSTNSTYALAPVGGHLLSGLPYSNGYPQKMLDYRFGGGEPTTVFGYAPGTPVVAADGSVIAVGGADRSSVAVHRYVDGADNELTDTTVLDLPPVPGRNAGIALSRGYLRHVEGFPQLDGTTQFRLFNHALAADAGDPEQPSTYPRKLSATMIRCQDGQECVRGADDHVWGMPYLTTDSSGQARIEAVGGSVAFTLPTTGGRIVDSDRNFVIVAGASGQQYVAYLSQDEIVASGPITGAALWDATLWQAPTTGTAGTLTATDLITRKIVRTISVGTCRPTDVQVAQHWLYWSCGVSGPAGVYDLTTGTKTGVPAGRALLGDGYVVRHDTAAGTLRLTDVHTGTAAPERTIATLPASERGVTWAVDRFGGDLAYVDGDGATHVLDPGVPASTPTAYVEWTHPWIEVRAGEQWEATLTVSRPVDGWRLTITRASTGAVVHTATGGASRGPVYLGWDMHLPDGSMPPSGPYHWQLTATVGGGTATVGGASGYLTVECGTRPFRSYDCDGSAALLAVHIDADYGRAAWWQGNAAGTLTSNGYTEDWQLGSRSTDVSALVPFGDINDDGYGDLLARTGDGVVYAHLGIGQASFGGRTKVRLGGGYNAYNALLSVGDVDRDGYDDLLERDTSGTVWFKGGTGKTSLKARVQIATGWNTYTRLAAVGDVNGNGRGDLLAVDHNNIVWRYYGAAGGTFPSGTCPATGGPTWSPATPPARSGATTPPPPPRTRTA